MYNSSLLYMTPQSQNLQYLIHHMQIIFISTTTETNHFAKIHKSGFLGTSIRKSQTYVPFLPFCHTLVFSRIVLCRSVFFSLESSSIGTQISDLAILFCLLRILYKIFMSIKFVFIDTAIMALTMSLCVHLQCYQIIGSSINKNVFLNGQV